MVRQAKVRISRIIPTLKIILWNFRDPTCLNLRNICGYILNVPSDYKISFITLPLRRRHWITVREFNGLYYNLDSKLDCPQIIGRVICEY